MSIVRACQKVSVLSPSCPQFSLLPVLIINFVVTGTGDGAELQQVEVPVIDRSTCSLWYNETITPDAFCAGYIFGGRDSCKVRGTDRFLTLNGQSITIFISGQNESFNLKRKTHNRLKRTHFIRKKKRKEKKAVSYTHLTLPTMAVV